MPAVTGTSDLPMFIPSEMSLDSCSAVKTSRSVNLHSLLYSECEKLVTAECSKFETIKSQLLKDGKLYEDDSFFTQDFFEDMIVRRPKEICGDPKFYVDGHSRFDVNQGHLADCSFLATLAELAMNKKLVSQVVPQGREQSFDDGEYVGMFRFRFWRFGEWVEVIIDDRLPIMKSDGTLKYNTSTVTQEFWSPLLEKAYAKFRGMTYNSIVSRAAIEAMQNLTGGLTELYSLSNAPTGLFTILLKAYEKNALISCGIDKNPDSINKLKETGLIENHEYSMTKVMNLHTDTGVVQLLRIRNPWGKREWTGAWSDKSLEWNHQSIPDTKKQELGLIIKEDGEFWMSYDDFIKYFDNVSLCHLGSDSADPENQLKITSIKGKWIKGVSAGGFEWLSFSSNPQYMITMLEADEGNTENKCEIIVGLTHKDGIRRDDIRFSVILLPITANLPKPLDVEFMTSIATRFRSGTLKNSLRLTLDPGSYIIIPSTAKPNQEDEFLLRVISQKNVQITEYDGDLQLSTPEKKVNKLLDMGVNFSEDLFNAEADHGTVGVEKFAEFFNDAFFQEMKRQKIDIDVIKKIMVWAGKDPKAKLSFKEFKLLWVSLKQWQTAFKRCCSTGTNTIPRLNLRAALRAAGWTVNVKLIQRLIKRFDLTEETISFVDFIHCILGVAFVNKRQKASQLKVAAASDNKETPKIEDDAVEK